MFIEISPPRPLFCFCLFIHYCLVHKVIWLLTFINRNSEFLKASGNSCVHSHKNCQQMQPNHWKVKHIWTKTSGQKQKKKPKKIQLKISFSPFKVSLWTFKFMYLQLELLSILLFIPFKKCSLNYPKYTWKGERNEQKG